jgi:hypothetical protein
MKVRYIKLNSNTSNESKKLQSNYIWYMKIKLDEKKRNTACIKMIGAVWKLIVFTSMVNRIINISRNERVTLQVYDTCLQMLDV